MSDAIRALSWADDEIRVNVPNSDWQGGTYVDIDGLVAILEPWLAQDVRNAYVQEGDDDAILVLSYWDEDAARQTVDVIGFDTDAEREIGFGWSLSGLPFAVDVTASPAPAPSLTNGPVRVADLDGSVDAADWIQPGHVLDASEVEYIRALVLPGSVALPEG